MFVLLPAIGSSKEESKIQVRLEAVNNGNGNGNGNGVGRGKIRGDLRIKLQGDDADLQLRTRGLDPGDYAIVATDEMGEEHLIATFTAGSNGSANVREDLTDTGDGNEAPVDPRGKFVSVRPDGGSAVDDVLGGWVYGHPDDDPPMTKVKELTALEPNDPSIGGRADARYDMRPNGRGALVISLRGLDQGTYEIWVMDGNTPHMTELTTNSGGNARVAYSTRQRNGNGKSKGHNKRGFLNFDPRRKLIEVTRVNEDTTKTLYFSGLMIAQIEGLNSCTDGVRATAELAAEPPDPTRSGSAVLETESDCETAFQVDVEGLPIATYDLYVDDAMVGQIEVMDDAGTMRGTVRFDPTPDEADELPLDFEVRVGSVVEVIDMGADPTMDPALLSGVLE
jgi:hypothetical protein